MGKIDAQKPITGDIVCSRHDIVLRRIIGKRKLWWCPRCEAKRNVEGVYVQESIVIAAPAVQIEMAL